MGYPSLGGSHRVEHHQRLVVGHPIRSPLSFKFWVFGLQKCIDNVEAASSHSCLCQDNKQTYIITLYCIHIHIQHTDWLIHPSYGNGVTAADLHTTKFSQQSHPSISLLASLPPSSTLLCSPPCYSIDCSPICIIIIFFFFFLLLLLCTWRWIYFPNPARLVSGKFLFHYFLKLELILSTSTSLGLHLQETKRQSFFTNVNGLQVLFPHLHLCYSHSM